MLQLENLQTLNGLLTTGGVTPISPPYHLVQRLGALVDVEDVAYLDSSLTTDGDGRTCSGEVFIFTAHRYIVAQAEKAPFEADWDDHESTVHVITRSLNELEEVGVTGNSDGAWSQESGHGWPGRGKVAITLAGRTWRLPFGESTGIHKREALAELVPKLLERLAKGASR